MSQVRKPESCTYRQHVFSTADRREYACCMLLTELTGIDGEDRDRLQVSRKACEVCCKKSPPSKEEINSVVASLLYRLSMNVSDEGGVPGCDKKKADELQEWAKNNLQQISLGNEERKFPDVAKEPCFYLGANNGTRECQECAGSVRRKTFVCHHEDHEETTITDCMACRDYEVPLAAQTVKEWAVGVTTAPRADDTLESSLESLGEAGWDDFFVFAEPGSALAIRHPDEKLIRRKTTYGAWPNWLVSALELAMLRPEADAYLICQDDVVYARGLRAYLEENLWPSNRFGVISLHTPSHRSRPNWSGFHPDNEGWRAWGAQAYLFSNASLRAMLRAPSVINHRQRGPARGERNIDSVIGYWCAISGLDYIIHQPSLTQHIGDTSTLWKDATTAGKRQASNFVEDTQSITNHPQNDEGLRKEKSAG